MVNGLSHFRDFVFLRIYTRSVDEKGVAGGQRLLRFLHLFDPRTRDRCSPRSSSLDS